MTNVPESLRQQLADFSDQIRHLPDPKEPPKTTLHILRRGQREQAWQRMLFYFLAPEESHGLETELLEHILSSLAERHNIDVPLSYFEVENIRVETEVTLSNDGRADAVIWSPDAWFICWELKVYASEGGTQTSAYVDADHFRSIEHDKNDFDGHYYVYLAPERASPPHADEFVQVSWEWIASVIHEFLEEGYGQYPARTTAQLEDFVATIKQELTMTEHQAHEREKSKLLLGILRRDH